MDEYSDCYIFRYDYSGFRLWDDPCNGRPAYIRLWFLPFQKANMRKRIKQDIYEILDSMLADNGIGTVDYEVSGDFEEITIYLYHDQDTAE